MTVNMFMKSRQEICFSFLSDISGEFYIRFIVNGKSLNKFAFFNAACNR